MNDDALKKDRRSTRLSISIPVIISGVDAEGNSFSETVRTLVANKHGGKITTAHNLAMGTQLLVENRALGVVCKATVAWLGERRSAGGLHPVGLQLLEAQNIWGIAFPPDDWHPQHRAEDAASLFDPPVPASAQPLAEVPLPSPAGEEITIHLLQELQGSADAHAVEFQERLKQLSHQMGLEFEIDLRERAARTKDREAGALEREAKALWESLRGAKEEMGKLEVRIQEMQAQLQALQASPSAAPLKEAQRQLAELSNSVVERMNRAADEGLREYRQQLQKEKQESAAPPKPAARKPSGS